MPLDARSRSSIYQKLVPLLGEEDTTAMMAAFPGVEGDELVTKQFLRAEMAELRTEMAEMKHQLTLMIGGAVAASTTLLAAIGLFT
jgi:hypothetical protein